MIPYEGSEREREDDEREQAAIDSILDRVDERIYMVTANFKVGIQPGERIDGDRVQSALGPMQRVLLARLPDDTMPLSSRLTIRDTEPGSRP